MANAILLLLHVLVANFLEWFSWFCESYWKFFSVKYLKLDMPSTCMCLGYIVYWQAVHFSAKFYNFPPLCKHPLPRKFPTTWYLSSVYIRVIITTWVRASGMFVNGGIYIPVSVHLSLQCVNLVCVGHDTKACLHNNEMCTTAIYHLDESACTSHASTHVHVQ